MTDAPAGPEAPEAPEAPATQAAGPRRKGVSRRLLIVGGLALGGGLAVGVGLYPYSRTGEQRRLLAREGESVLQSAVRISREGVVTVVYPHADMGVGNGTALAQLLAEELGADWPQIRIERAPAHIAFANGALGQAYLRGETEIPAALAGLSWLVTRRIAEGMRLQITGGSTAIAFTGMEGMRHAGASARWMLTRAAAAEWRVPAREVTIENGRILHAASGKEAGFGAFAEAALAFDPPARLPFRAKADYRQVGQSRARLDIPAKVTGEAKYSGDLRLPGMAFAAIRACPTPGGRLASCDAAPAAGRRGVHRVVTTPTAVAVLADNFWRARTAVEALQPQWAHGSNATLDSARTIEAMKASVASDRLKKDHAQGSAERVLAEAGEKVIERVYTAPYLAHAPMETVGCVAQFADGGLVVWGAFQDALAARYQAAKTSGLPVDRVTIHHTEMGGAFGRRGGTLDYLDHAIALAREWEGPVNLIYTREEDTTHDFYRNPSVARMRAVLAEDGRPLAVAHHYAERHDPPDASRFPYAFEAVDVRFSSGDNLAPWGPWRSVDHSVQGFFIESFIDELAQEAGEDPYLYRRRLLAQDARSLAVLDAAADMSGWTQNRSASVPKPMGIALKKSFGTVVCEVAEIAIRPDGSIHVPRVWVAADPGLVVNPNGFAQQMESGVIYGLTAALYGEITFEGGQVKQRNFWDYPMVRMSDCPRIEVRLLESGALTGGAGEPGTPPIAAAVANAVFAATGERIRSLPLGRVQVRPQV